MTKQVKTNKTGDYFDRQQKVAHAAAQDAGNRNMQENGRTIWNQDDYYKASREYNRLYPAEEPFLRNTQ